MSLFCLELNSSRARAVCGPLGSARPVMLDDRERDLPLALSLEGRHPEVGRAGIELCRRLPHLACLDFLPLLGKAKSWTCGRQKINASKATSLLLERVRPLCAGVRHLSLVVPAYLGRTQVVQLAELVEGSRLPALAGSVTSPLAAAWAAHAQQPWCGLALVVDVDHHALTWTAVAADEPDSPQQVRVVVVQSVPQLGLKAWKEHVLDGIAERSIRQSRRDPRESAEAEQGLWEQFDSAFDSAARDEPVELIIQAAHWYQNLILREPDLAAFCKHLLNRAARSLHDLLGKVQAEGPPALVVLTASAARLPGLLKTLEENTSEQTAVRPLSADSVLRAAHELATGWVAQAVPCGHHDVALKLRNQGSGVRGLGAGGRGQGKTDTKLPGKKSKIVATDDDFSVGIDE